MFLPYAQTLNRTLAIKQCVGTIAVSLLLLTSCQRNSAEPPIVDSSATTEAATRTIEHAGGVSQIPLNPERVVVVDTAPLDAAIALGTTPIGSIVYGTLPAYLSDYLGDSVEDISIVGEGNQPNFEAILALKPDLILSSKPGSEKLYDQLSQIAPTVLATNSGRSGDWPDHFRLYAEALGKAEQAELLLQDYQAQVTQLRQKLTQPEMTKISVISPFEGQPWTYTAGSFPGSVLQAVGLSRNAAQTSTNRYATRLSKEALDKIDGDYIFLVYSDYVPGSFNKEAFISDPIWSRLDAVQQDNVCEVPNETWIAGRSILAASEILTDIEQCLGPAE